MEIKIPKTLQQRQFEEMVRTLVRTFAGLTEKQQELVLQRAFDFQAENYDLWKK